MKKLISLALAMAMFVCLFSGITALAADTDLVNIAFSAYATSNAPYNYGRYGNPASLAIDNDPNTCYSNSMGSASYAVYDLGAVYPISKIDITADNEKNGVQIILSETDPATATVDVVTDEESGTTTTYNALTNNGIDVFAANNKQIADSTMSTTKNKYTRDGEGYNARYVTIYKKWGGRLNIYNLEIFVTEAALKADTALVNVAEEANITYKLSDVVTSVYDSIDGDTSTFFTATGSTNYMIYDLGAEYPINRLKVVVPVESKMSNVAYFGLLQNDPTLVKDIAKDDGTTVSTDGLTKDYFEKYYETYGVYLNPQFDLSENKSSSNTNGYNTAKTTILNNANSCSITYTYTADSENVPTARYITILKPNSGTMGLSELAVYTNYKALANTTISANVARDKACFALYEPNSTENIKVKSNLYWMAVDGDASTFAVGRTWGNNDASKAPRFIVDLGAEYKLDNIVLKPYNLGTTNIYVTNSNNFATANLTTVASGVATTNGTVQTYTTYKTTEVQDDGEGGTAEVETEKNLSETGWRYIVIDRIATGGGNMLGIYEIEANTTVSKVDEKAVTASTKAYRISGGRDIYSTGSVSGDLNELCDGIYLYSGSSEARVAAVSGTRHYIYYDLGDSYEIPYTVVIPNNGYSGLNYGFDIVGTNSLDNFANNTCDTLSTVASYTKAGSTNYNADIWKLDTVSAYANNKYRYVGIRGASGCQMNLLEFEVFTDDSNFEQALGNVTATISALDDDGVADDVTIASNGATTANGSGTYKVIVASYDENDKMLDADFGEITFSTDSRSDEKFTIDIKDIVADEAAYVKAFIVNDFDNITPAMDNAVKTMVE